MPCAVPGCVNKGSRLSRRQCRLHKVPKNEPVRSMWLKLIGRQDIPRDVGARICHLHFTPEDYTTNTSIAHRLGVQYRANLKRVATPSLNLPGSSEPKELQETQDPCAAAFGDTKPTAAQLDALLRIGSSDAASDITECNWTDAERVLQAVPGESDKYDVLVSGVPAVDVVQLPSMLKQDLTCRNVSVRNEEASLWPYEATLKDAGTQARSTKADFTTQTVSLEYIEQSVSKGTQVDFQVKFSRAISVQASIS